MKSFFGVLLVFLTLFYCGVVSQAASKPSAKDLALQAGTGVVGYIIGTSMGSLGAQLILSNVKVIDCAAAEWSNQSGAKIGDAQGSIESGFSCAALRRSLEIGTRQELISASASLGTFGGILLAARIQGYDGSILGASLALYVAKMLVAFETLSFEKNIWNDAIFNRSAPTDARSNTLRLISDNETSMAIWLFSPFIIVAATLLGYYLF
ncbi:hypothetical protein HYR53_10850 [Candidatus Acetothermia bacterium]|nr:hypothetical protein [Candidatus Acetothermia bacterium]